MDLRRDERRQSGDTALLERAAHGAVSRGEAMELLGLSRTAAYARLRRLTEEHRLIRIGGKYYLPGTVVPPGGTAYGRTELFGAGRLRLSPGDCPAAACAAQTMHLDPQANGDLGRNCQTRTKVPASGTKGGITYIKAPPAWGGAFCSKSPMLPFAYK